MPSRVRWPSAASTSACMPPTISATRSASARAACSRSSASRSACRRSRSVVSVMKPEANTSPRASTFDTVASPGKAAPVAAHQLDLERLRGARVGAVQQREPAALSWRSAYSGGMISSRILLPDRLVLGPAEHPLARPRSRS